MQHWHFVLLCLDHVPQQNSGNVTQFPPAGRWLCSAASPTGLVCTARVTLCFVSEWRLHDQFTTRTLLLCSMVLCWLIVQSLCLTAGWHHLHTSYPD